MLFVSYPYNACLDPDHEIIPFLKVRNQVPIRKVSFYDLDKACVMKDKITTLRNYYLVNFTWSGPNHILKSGSGDISKTGSDLIKKIWIIVKHPGPGSVTKVAPDTD